MKGSKENVIKCTREVGNRYKKLGGDFFFKRVEICRGKEGMLRHKNGFLVWKVGNSEARKVFCFFSEI